ncbi:hypothetical protein FRX31_006689 [Thalictrum thalictroides]|uniref:RRM domain-containing protein n=1 Tax=Thalictrum thalictroides TaxID=46969 RepID=A0A7J6X227_THATH|nr:hypothetical protein FRX31_006689 [Thalictrum thalictroides]
MAVSLIPVLCRALEHLAKFLRRNFSRATLYRWKKNAFLGASSIVFTRAKRKDFGFVSFDTHDNAVICAESINNAELGDGDNKGMLLFMYSGELPDLLELIIAQTLNAHLPYWCNIS